LGIVQKKVGYFETKGSLHFKKHYLGPLADMSSLKKYFQMLNFRKYTKKVEKLEEEQSMHAEAIKKLNSFRSQNLDRCRCHLSILLNV